jgi:hypothetical protein
MAVSFSFEGEASRNQDKDSANAATGPQFAMKVLGSWHFISNALAIRREAWLAALHFVPICVLDGESYCNAREQCRGVEDR